MNWLALLTQMLGPQWAQHLQGDQHPLGMPNFLSAFQALHDAHPAAANAGSMSSIPGANHLGASNPGSSYSGSVTPLGMSGLGMMSGGGLAGGFLGGGGNISGGGVSPSNLGSAGLGGFGGLLLGMGMGR